MNSRRRALLGAALSAPFACAWAAPAGPRRIGILSVGTEDEVREFLPELTAALRSAGWTVGKDLVLEFRYAPYIGSGPPRRDALARELVAAKPDLLITQGTPNTRALHHATRSIPIVTNVDNPVASGFARSLSKPGGNVTGLAGGGYQYVEKRVELLKAVVPKLARIGFFTTTGYGSQGLSAEITDPLRDAAARFGASSDFFVVHDLDGFDRAFRQLKGNNTCAAYIMNFAGDVEPERLAALAIERRMPTFHQDPDFVVAGGLLAYSFTFSDELHIVIGIVDRVLRGANPGDIPFELPNRATLVVNRKTADALGLVIPPEVLVRADRVIG